MADADLRELERQARLGDGEARRLWLQGRRRARTLSGDQLELLAYCGDEVARLLVGHPEWLPYVEEYGRGSWRYLDVRGQDLDRFVAGLRWGRRLRALAVVAAAEVVLETVARLGVSLGVIERIVEAARRWIQVACVDCCRWEVCARVECEEARAAWRRRCEDLVTPAARARRVDRPGRRGRWVWVPWPDWPRRGELRSSTLSAVARCEAAAEETTAEAVQAAIRAALTGDALRETGEAGLDEPTPAV